MTISQPPTPQPSRGEHTASGISVPIHLQAWDPLAPSDDDLTVYAAAQKREIRNILKSYTGYYDLFAELIQNALDAVEKRLSEKVADYKARLWIDIDLASNAISVTDNGCAMVLQQFQRFLKPNFSFKDGPASRGSKGVGATYLAFGFNHLELFTKPDSNTVYAGILRAGRTWLDDETATITKPKVEPITSTHLTLDSIDRGTNITLRLSGDSIRPKSLQYFGAKTAEQWLAILRAHTPLGGIYLCGQCPPPVHTTITVKSEDGTTTCTMDLPRYLYPHEVLGKTADLREFLRDQAARANKGLDTSKTPPKFANLNGIWGEWSHDEILDNKSPLKPQLDEQAKELMRDLQPEIYAFMCYTTDLWDDYNDEKLRLRKGTRLLRGGLQQATRHMPQGSPIPIPLTNNIGFQQITHVVVHFQNSEPDLGRKGFQPEHTQLAETLSRAAVTALRRFFERLLRKNTGAPGLLQEMKLSQWIDEQRDHERNSPLIIQGKGLFAPQFELPIRSEPLVEQDVVALFNQMLSSGLIRGIHLLASSQFNQYDGLFRFRISPPFETYIRNDDNPLGVLPEIFAGTETEVVSSVQVLEYKHNLNHLIEELDNETKKADEIGLAVCWELGDKWRAHFEALSYLDNDNLHHREFHGITHSLRHAVSGQRAFDVIVLKDLVTYLTDQAAESARQRQTYSADPD